MSWSVPGTGYVNVFENALASSQRLTSAFPLMAASCSGVSPSKPRAHTLAPARINILAIFSHPWLHASCSGVEPEAKQDRRVSTSAYACPATHPQASMLPLKKQAAVPGKHIPRKRRSATQTPKKVLGNLRPTSLKHSCKNKKRKARMQ